MGVGGVVCKFLRELEGKSLRGAHLGNGVLAKGGWVDDLMMV